jgi:hypothetical protein
MLVAHVSVFSIHMHVHTSRFTCHMSRDTCHMSSIACHMSHVARHMSHVIQHMPHMTLHISRACVLVGFNADKRRHCGHDPSGARTFCMVTKSRVSACSNARLHPDITWHRHMYAPRHHMASSHVCCRRSDALGGMIQHIDTCLRTHTSTCHTHTYLHTHEHMPDADKPRQDVRVQREPPSAEVVPRRQATAMRSECLWYSHAFAYVINMSITLLTHVCTHACKPVLASRHAATLLLSSHHVMQPRSCCPRITSCSHALAVLASRHAATLLLSSHHVMQPRSCCPRITSCSHALAVLASRHAATLLLSSHHVMQPRSCCPRITSCSHALAVLTSRHAATLLPGLSSNTLYTTCDVALSIFGHNRPCNCPKVCHAVVSRDGLWCTSHTQIRSHLARKLGVRRVHAAKILQKTYRFTLCLSYLLA